VSLCRHRYYLSKVLVELPFQIILPTIMTVIVHPMLNLQGRIEVIGFFIILLTNVGQALGMIVGCAFKDRDVAMQVGLCPLAVVVPTALHELTVN
jgi:hypothetical protein